MAAVAVACLMLLAPGMAKAGWSAPAIVSGVGTSVSQTRIAGDSEGTSWVVWKRIVAGFNVIQGTRVQTDGTQGPIVTFSPALQNATDPVVESRADGTAMVGWINQSGTSNFVQTASIAADGTVGAAVNRSANGPAGQNASDLAIALGKDGTAGLTWLRYNGTAQIVQGLRVAADGTSGAVHNLSDATAAPGPPDVGAAPPAIDGDPYFYRIMWPQGSGADSQVAGADINANDTVTAAVLLYTPPAAGSPPDCADPFDVQIAYSASGLMSAFWVCYKKTLDTGSGETYFNWSVQWLHIDKGSPLGAGNASNASLTENASPTVYGNPYPISGVVAAQSFNGWPAIAWIHDLDGGDQRVETWRVIEGFSNGLVVPVGQGWANTKTQAPTIESPSIAVNSSTAAIAGGVNPGLLPGQPTASFTRFSPNFYGPVTLSGSFVYSDDPGFVVGENGKSMASFTAIDGSSIGTARVMVYDDPGLRVNPDSYNYGKVNIGQSRTTTVTIGSSGETVNTVTAITLGGANADRFSMSGASGCVRQMLPNTVCTFQVRFDPASTATQTAQVAVTSDGGNDVVNLTGRGLNQTRNRITAKPGHAARRKGKVVKVRVKASNLGGVSSNNTRICVNLRKRALKLAGNRCRNLGAIAAGASRTLNYRIRVTWRAKRGARLPVTFVMRANNAVVRQVVVNVRRKGR